MEGRAKIDLGDFDALMSGEGAEDIESTMLTPFMGFQKVNGITEIDIDMIDDFPNHPFMVKNDAKMDELVEDICKYGVVHPVVVRETMNGRYQMISGHRRIYASRRAGKKTIPARIMNLSDDDAIILMTNTNFLQRTEIKPSEKAKAYRMKYEAIKRQGKNGGSSFEEIGEATRESGKTVQRFIRLSYLIDDLLNLADKRKLGIFQGVELSYCSVDVQKMVYRCFCGSCFTTISRAQASKIKNEAKEGKLDIDRIRQIINDGKECFEVKTNITLNADILSKYFGNSKTVEEVELIITNLLDKWKEENRYE